MLNGVSLFTGYAGIDIALSEYVRPIIFCEIEPYAQAIILSRMDDRSINFAPIWNDVTTLNGDQFKGLADIIYGGFPCQDISVAGKGAGLEGKRSGLFFEICRLIKEIKPPYVFLENVPAIRTRGAIEVQEALSGLGYDSRWCTLSAAEIGANHKRERWFCLAFNADNGKRDTLGRVQKGKTAQPPRVRDNVSDTECDGKRAMPRACSRTKTEYKELQQEDRETCPNHTESLCADVASSDGERLQGLNESNLQGRRIKGRLETGACSGKKNEAIFRSDWWTVEPNVGRVANGVEFRAHRIKALGNGVVPLQVKTAFEILMGIKKGY